MRILKPDIGFKRLVRSLGRLAFVQANVPDFDVANMNLDVLKVLQNAYIEEGYAPELKPAFSMFPCVYRGQTYLVDSAGSLWAIDGRGYLSIWFVGGMHGYDGVEGFVTDLLRYRMGRELEVHLGKYLAENIANPSGE